MLDLHEVKTLRNANKIVHPPNFPHKTKFFPNFFDISTKLHARFPHKIDPADYNLPTNYKDFYRITPKNFDSRVINSPETWVVVISPSNFDFDYNWKKESRIYRGSAFFGVIDAKEYPKFALQVYFQASNSHDWNGKEVAAVFKGKHVKPEIANNPWKAMKIATRINKIGGVKQFTPTKEDEMYNFVVPAFYHSQPYARFPVLMVYDDAGPIPLVQRMIGNDRLFQVYFEFRVMKSSEFDNLKLLFKDVPKPDSFPHYLGLVGKEPASGGDELTFDVVSFEKKKFKEPKSYKSVSEFLFWMHKEYRTALPGKKPTETAESLIEPLARAINGRLKFTNKKHDEL